MKYLLPFLFTTVLFLSCQKPKKGPVDGDIIILENGEWGTLPPRELGIAESEIESLKGFLAKNNTRAFLLLKDGKIVLEEYFGKDILSGKPFDANSYWYWASAGKSLTSLTVGLAQERGFLDISQKTSDFLGEGWTSAPREKEALITVKHQLTMTSGLDASQNADCWDPGCLKYRADAGTRWDYHNAPYTLLDKVVANATKQSFDDFFNANLRDKIGMDGFWQYVDDNHVYFSTARSMARYGLLMLNNGEWQGETVISDKAFLHDMIHTSQNLNESYGYLWWLNGQNSAMVPGLPIKFNRWITPNAPKDMYAAMGKNGQQLNIVPSKNLVVVRMGEAPDDGQLGLQFQDDLWGVLGKIID